MGKGDVFPAGKMTTIRFTIWFKGTHGRWHQWKSAASKVEAWAKVDEEVRLYPNTGTYEWMVYKTTTQTKREEAPR